MKVLLAIGGLVGGIWAISRYKGALDMRISPGFAFKYPFEPIASIRSRLIAQRQQEYMVAFNVDSTTALKMAVDQIEGRGITVPTVRRGRLALQ